MSAPQKSELKDRKCLSSQAKWACS